MKRKIITMWLVVTVLASAVVSIYGGVPNEPHPGNAMWIEPSIIVLKDKPVGYKFNITLWVNLTDVPHPVLPDPAVGAWQACVVYDKTLLNYIRHGWTARTPPDHPVRPNKAISEWFKSAGMWKNSVLFTRGSINATHDYILPGEMWQFPDPGEPDNPMAPEGSYGSLIWIEFQLLDKPTPPYVDYIQFLTTGPIRCKILALQDSIINDIAYTFSFYSTKIEIMPIFGPIDYFQTFCPSPAVANLGINNYNGEPDADLEIVTGTDEWYGWQRWHCFDSTGAHEWTLPTGCDESRTSVAIADIDGDGDLEIAGGTTSGWELQVFDHTGRFIWKYYPGYYVFWKSSPAICDVNPFIPGLEVIAATYQDGTVWCFNGITGAVLWKYTTGFPTESTPACGDVDADGDIEVVIGATDGKVYCLNGRLGSLERTYLTGGAVYSSAALANLDADPNLEVVIGSNDGKVYCFDGGAATLEWSRLTGGSVFSSPAIGDVDADGRYEVIIGSNDGKIYCLSGSTGISEWSYTTGGAVISSAALANRGGTGLGIYIGSMDRCLYVINGTGALIFSFNTNATNGITSSPAVADVDEDDKLEIMFTDWNAIPDDPLTTNRFWILKDPGSTCSTYSIEWQMFRRDPCRRGVYPMITIPYPHDVAIVSVKPSKLEARSGEIIYIDADVENQGDYTESFNVTAYYNGNKIGSQSVINLAPEAATTVMFPWDTTGVPLDNYTVSATADVVPGETDVVDNTYVDGQIKILPQLIHDVAITGLKPTKIFIVTGEIVNVNVTAENQGNYAESFNVTVFYYPGANVTASHEIGKQIVTLSSGATINVTLAWNTTNVPKGIYSISAEASPVPDEIDLTDNKFGSVVQVRVAVHDIAIAYVTLSKTVVGQGYTNKIVVEVINQGDFAETFNITLYADFIEIEKQKVTLAGGKSTTLPFIWNTTGFAKGNYTIKAVADTVSGETDTADNSFIDGWVYVGLVGDVNADGIVDIEDIYKISLAYGSVPVDGEYWHPIPCDACPHSPNMDINSDKIVDIEDIYIASLHYGEKDP